MAAKAATPEPAGLARWLRLARRTRRARPPAGLLPAATAAPAPVIGSAGGNGTDGNIIAGLNSAGTNADSPSANNAHATGGNGGNGSAGQTGGNAPENANVFAINDQNAGQRDRPYRSERRE